MLALREVGVCLDRKRITGRRDPHFPTDALVLERQMICLLAIDRFLRHPAAGRRVSQKRLSRGRIQKVGDRCRDAVPLVHRIEHLVERLRHPRLSEDLIAVHHERQADTVVPPFVLGVAGRLEIDAIGTAQSGFTRQRPRARLAIRSELVPDLLRRHR